jgi:hypothetical protein
MPLGTNSIYGLAGRFALTHLKPARDARRRFSWCGDDDPIRWQLGDDCGRCRNFRRFRSLPNHGFQDPGAVTMIETDVCW